MQDLGTAARHSVWEPPATEASPCGLCQEARGAVNRCVGSVSRLAAIVLPGACVGPGGLHLPHSTGGPKLLGGLHAPQVRSDVEIVSLLWPNVLSALEKTTTVLSTVLQEIAYRSALFRGEATHGDWPGGRGLSIVYGAEVDALRASRPRQSERSQQRISRGALCRLSPSRGDAGGPHVRGESPGLGKFDQLGALTSARGSESRPKVGVLRRACLRRLGVV